MNVKAAEKICEVVGKIVHSTDPAETEGGNFMRIRVEMDVSLPLCRGRVVSMEKGKKILGHFQIRTFTKYLLLVRQNGPLKL